MCVHRYLTGQMTGHWLVFFTLQGPLVTLEGYLKRLGRQHNLQVPRWVSIPATYVVLLYLADLYFFPPVFVTGLADRITTSLLQTLSYTGLIITPGHMLLQRRSM